MLFAPIVPTNLLHLIEGYPYHMSLAHIVLQSAKYAMFYRRKARDTGTLVILDNGAAEGGQMDYKSWITAVKTVKPNEVVLYDALYDAEQTMIKTEQSYQCLRENELLHGIPMLMGVPHGKTVNDILDCAVWMIQQPYITTIGISKFFTSQFDDPDARFIIIDQLLDRVGSEFPQELHILGCHNSLGELIDLKMFFGQIIRGTDTALPSIFAKESKLLTATQQRNHSIELDFVRDEVVHPDVLSRNIYLMAKELRQ